ncbi:MAG TPA: lipase secretion chaperone, partial [Rhizobacter sp.]
ARRLYAAEVARIFADPNLSEWQQQQRLLALRMNLPPEVAAEEFGGAEFSLAMERQVAAMRARGESDDEVVHLRRQFVEVEGGKSVIEIERERLDTERQVWALRHPGFIRERDQVYAAALGVEDTAQRLEALLQAHFAPAERERARQLGGL